MASEPRVTLRQLAVAFLRSRAHLTLLIANLEHNLVLERERADRWRRKYRRISKTTTHFGGAGSPHAETARRGVTPEQAKRERA